jgi:hypothetical protein
MLARADGTYRSQILERRGQMNGGASLFIAMCLAAGMLCQTARAQTTESNPPLGDPGEAPSKGAVKAEHGVPNVVCRPGYEQQGFWLCMTGSRGPASFANAMLDCMDSGGRVADYHDWRYRIFRADGFPTPVGWWLGPITADNTALYVNLPNIADYDGETSRFDSRNYACAHDLSR